jgi:hypothetical protein
MKRYLCVALFCLLSLASFADVIYEGYHGVSRTITIANCSEYAGSIVLVAYIRALNGDDETYAITDSTVLTKGYKFNYLYLVPFTKAAYDAYGKIPPEDKCAEIVQNKSIAAFPLEPYAEMTDTCTVASEKVVYKITAANASSVSLKIAQITFSFTDGTADRTYYW